MARRLVNIEKLLDRAQRWVFLPLIFVCLVILLLWTVDPVRTWFVSHGWLKDVESVVGIALVVTIFVLVSFDQRLGRTVERLDAFSPSASSRICKGGVSTIYTPLHEALKELEQARAEKTLDVLGLTLYTAWPQLLRPKLVDGSLRDWHVKVYCLCPDFIKDTSCFPSDWVMQSQSFLSTIQTFMNNNSQLLKRFGTTLTVSKYTFFPAIHGFRTGAGHLFVSYIHWANPAEQIVEPMQFYELFQPSDRSMRAEVYRELFANWVERAKKESAARPVV